jgi:hypothetical protein
MRIRTLASWGVAAFAIASAQSRSYGGGLPEDRQAFQRELMRVFDDDSIKPLKGHLLAGGLYGFGGGGIGNAGGGLFGGGRIGNGVGGFSPGCVNPYPDARPMPSPTGGDAKKPRSRGDIDPSPVQSDTEPMPTGGDAKKPRSRGDIDPSPVQSDTELMPTGGDAKKPRSRGDIDPSPVQSVKCEFQTVESKNLTSAERTQRQIEWLTTPFRALLHIGEFAESPEDLEQRKQAEELARIFVMTFSKPPGHVLNVLSGALTPSQPTNLDQLLGSLLVNLRSDSALHQSKPASQPQDARPVQQQDARPVQQDRQAHQRRSDAAESRQFRREQTPKHQQKSDPNRSDRSAPREQDRQARERRRVPAETAAEGRKDRQEQAPKHQEKRNPNQPHKSAPREQNQSKDGAPKGPNQPKSVT